MGGSLASCFRPASGPGSSRGGAASNIQLRGRQTHSGQGSAPDGASHDFRQVAPFTV